MLADNISVFDFSHQYDYLREQADFYFDCSLFSGTNAYCSDEAAEELRAEVSKAVSIEKNNAAIHENEDSGTANSARHSVGVHFIDSGNYHYMSLFFLERIETDFNLLLIDNHTDMNENAFGDILSCGNWVRKALETLPHLMNVFMLGVNKSYFQEMKDSLISEDKLAENPENEKELFFIDASASKEKPFSLRNDENTGMKKIIKLNSDDEIPQTIMDTFPFYISLDKDALSEEYAATDWDQGEMTLNLLKQIYSKLPQKNNMGFDICGDTKKADALNQEINIKIISYLRDIGWE